MSRIRVHIDRKKQRRFGKNDGVFSLSRRFTLAPISAGGAAQEADDVVDVEGLMIEPAWDGQRVLATRFGDTARIAAADFREWTPVFPTVARALTKLPARSVALDGVICVLDERGAPSFERLRARVASGGVASAVIICWDVMWIDDEDLRPLPLRQRRARLAKLLAGAPPSLMLSQSLDGTLDRVLAAASSVGLRGVVVRRLDAAYDDAWRAFSTESTPVAWQRSLSAPPPLSNADKVLYPRDGICKRDIVAYYRDIASLLLPHLVDRPVVTQRWPDGIDEFDWYQHRMPPRAPDYLRPAWVDGIRRVVVENVDALAWMANQAGLTFHGFASRFSSLSSPDYAMIDLDPGHHTTWWRDTIDVALGVRKLLELLELPSVVKTSGQRGLHILVPLGPGHEFTQAEELSRRIAMMMRRLMPDKVTLETEKEKRAGRLLVDHKQFVAKTLVVPYSLRAVDGAPISMPISWDEVTPSLDPKAFTLRTARMRLDARGDLAAPLLAGTVQIDRALTQLRGD